MKRRTVKKSVERRRRRNRFRKLKVAALSLGLATAWGGAADNATAGTLGGSLTVTVSDGVTFSSDTSSATITLSTASRIGVTAAGEEFTVPATLAPDATGYYYAGVVGEDLALTFPGDGSQAIGVFWGNLFGGGTSDFVGEAELVAQLQQSPPTLRDGLPVPDQTAFARFDSIYGGSQRSPLEQQSTLIVFSGPGNTGVFAGTLTASSIPEPASAALLAMATGVTLVGVRRRE